MTYGEFFNRDKNDAEKIARVFVEEETLKRVFRQPPCLAARRIFFCFNRAGAVHKVKFAVVEFTVVELVETSKPPYVV